MSEMTMKNAENTKNVVVLGTFDGVHIGHRTLVNAAKEIANETNANVVIYTFSEHPKSVLGGKPQLLMTKHERLNALNALGCRVVADEFDAALANTSPEDFIKNLCTRFNVCAVVAGYNYSFGHRGAGKAALLQELGKRHGFVVKIVEPVTLLAEAVSSSRIRGELMSGNVELAAKLLAANYSLCGLINNQGENQYELCAVSEEKTIPLAGEYEVTVWQNDSRVCGVAAVNSDGMISLHTGKKLQNANACVEIKKRI